MRFAFIDEHRRQWPVRVHVRRAGGLAAAAITPGESVRPAPGPSDGGADRRIQAIHEQRITMSTEPHGCIRNCSLKVRPAIVRRWPNA